MIAQHEYARHDAVGLAALVASGEVTPGELLDAAIARADEVAGLNAITARLDDRARDAIAAGLPDGSFRGVPFLVKDQFQDVAGTVTTASCSLLAKRPPASTDTTLVARYRAAGLVLFGKTNTPELAMSPSTEPAMFGPTRNPYDVERTPGGSSGGASAAVAAGIVPVAHASDGGGSIRIPAACCGLVGLKATRGRVPLGPTVFENWAGATCAHVVTRTVRDTAAFLDATAGGEPGDPYVAHPHDGSFLAEVGREPGRLRIAWTTVPLSGVDIDPEIAQATHATAARLEALGHAVEPIDTLPFAFPEMGRALSVVMGAGIVRLLDSTAAALGTTVTEDDVEPFTWGIYQRGKAFSAVDYLDAVAELQTASREAARLHRRFDVLLTPTLGQLPVALGSLSAGDLAETGQRMGRFSPFTTTANATGEPSISLPLARSSSGLPIGMMLTGRLGGEGVLLRLASQLEAAHPWSHDRLVGPVV